MHKINRAWHEANKMPKNPNLEARISWHQGHVKNCACRPIPATLLPEMKKKGLLHEK